MISYIVCRVNGRQRALGNHAHSLVLFMRLVAHFPVRFGLSCTCVVAESVEKNGLFFKDFCFWGPLEKAALLIAGVCQSGLFGSAC